MNLLKDPNENLKNPNEMTTEEKLTELVKIGRENKKLQHLNNMLLLSQNQEFNADVREMAKYEALNTLIYSAQIDEDFREIAVKEMCRMYAEKEAFEESGEEYQKGGGLGH